TTLPGTSPLSVWGIITDLYHFTVFMNEAIEPDCCLSQGYFACCGAVSQKRPRLFKVVKTLVRNTLKKIFIDGQIKLQIMRGRPGLVVELADFDSPALFLERVSIQA